MLLTSIEMIWMRERWRDPCQHGATETTCPHPADSRLRNPGHSESLQWRVFSGRACKADRSDSPGRVMTTLALPYVVLGSSISGKDPAISAPSNLAFCSLTNSCSRSHEQLCHGRIRYQRRPVRQHSDGCSVPTSTTCGRCVISLTIAYSPKLREKLTSVHP